MITRLAEAGGNHRCSELCVVNYGSVITIHATVGSREIGLFRQRY